MALLLPVYLKDTVRISFIGGGNGCFLQNVIDGAGSDSKLAGCFGNCAQMAYKDITIIVIENDATLPMHLMMT